MCIVCVCVYIYIYQIPNKTLFTQTHKTLRIKALTLRGVLNFGPDAFSRVGLLEYSIIGDLEGGGVFEDGGVLDADEFFE